MGLYHWASAMPAVVSYVSTADWTVHQEITVLQPMSECWVWKQCRDYNQLLDAALCRQAAIPSWENVAAIS